jgi:hypothetical protein
MPNTSIILILCGIFFLIYFLVESHRIKKFEFYNRTSGGLIGFTSYGKSVKHNLRKKVLNLSKLTGILLLGIGFLLLLLGL